VRAWRSPPVAVGALTACDPGDEDLSPGTPL